jgi:hypothetical protein
VRCAHGCVRGARAPGRRGRGGGSGRRRLDCRGLAAAGGRAAGGRAQDGGATGERAARMLLQGSANDLASPLIASHRLIASSSPSISFSHPPPRVTPAGSTALWCWLLRQDAATGSELAGSWLVRAGAGVGGLGKGRPLLLPHKAGLWLVRLPRSSWLRAGARWWWALLLPLTPAHPCQHGHPPCTPAVQAPGTAGGASAGPPPAAPATNEPTLCRVHPPLDCRWRLSSGWTRRSSTGCEGSVTRERERDWGLPWAVREWAARPRSRGRAFSCRRVHCGR